MEREELAGDSFVAADGVDAGNGYTVLERVTEGSNPERPSYQLELRKTGDTRTIAKASVAPAEDVSGLGLAGSALRTSALITTESTSPEASDMLAYAAVRRARIMNRDNILVRRSEANTIGRSLRLLPCAGDLLTQRVDIAIHYADQALVAGPGGVSAQFRAAEVAETARRWLATGRQWGFFKAVHERTLTKQQYVYALMNIYQFVRHTTRLVARCIAHSPSTEMRSHFINHLNGEVNHELIIERDLAHLGEDVEFMKTHMAPNAATHEFMANQESLIGYREDPILLMASPVAAEGVTGHLTEEFVAALTECLVAEGVTKPEKAIKFFVSHMHTDGGDDGHWEMTIAFLGKCLTNETKHQQFMRALRSAMHGTEGLYSSFVQEIPNWTPTTKNQDAKARTEIRA